MDPNTNKKAVTFYDNLIKEIEKRPWWDRCSPRWSSLLVLPQNLNKAQVKESYLRIWACTLTKVWGEECSLGNSIARDGSTNPRKYSSQEVLTSYMKGGKGNWHLFTLCSVPGPRDFPVHSYSHSPHPHTHIHCAESEAQRGQVVLSSIFWRTVHARALTTSRETQRNSEALMLEVKLRLFRNFSYQYLNAAAAAAAKSLQSCLTLCDPIDGSPPGSPVPGILQARILEWVAISFSNTCMHAKSLQSCPTLCNPMDSSTPGSSVHRILQVRILEWVATSFSQYLNGIC